MIINTSKIKLKYMENKLNSEKIKNNKKYIKKYMKNVFINNYNNNTKNISFNNSKILSDNFSTIHKPLNSKMDINSFFEKNKKPKIRTNNITPNIRRSIKIKKLKIITKINYSNSK